MKRVKIESEQLNKDIVAELERIRDNLKAKGDHNRARKVEKFKQEYFGEPASSATDEVPIR